MAGGIEYRGAYELGNCRVRLVPLDRQDSIERQDGEDGHGREEREAAMHKVFKVLPEGGPVPNKAISAFLMQESAWTGSALTRGSAGSSEGCGTSREALELPWESIMSVVPGIILNLETLTCSALILSWWLYS